MAVQQRDERVTVQVHYDPETKTWFFRVPARRIIGGGDTTREAALAHAGRLGGPG